MATMYANRRHATRSVIVISIATILLAMPGIVRAVPQGAFWVEIPTIDHPDDPTDLSGLRTHLLFVQLEEGDVVTAADFGIAGPNSGLSTNQSIFEHPVGTHLARDQFLLDLFPDLFYDTHLALGNLDGAASPSQISVQHFKTSDPSNIVGVWNPNAAAGFTEAVPDEDNLLCLGQFTISSEVEFGEGGGLDGAESLGGQLFLSGEGPNGEFGRNIAATGVVNIFNAYNLATSRLPGDDFLMLAPACGAVNVPPHHVVLEWEDFPSTFHRNVWVSTDFRFLSPFDYTADGIDSLSHTIPAGALEPCTTYYWFVRYGDFGFTRLAANWEFCAFTTSVLGDINADGAVDSADLGMMIDQFQTANPASDLNGDGVVDTADLGQLIAGFGQSCD